MNSRIVHCEGVVLRNIRYGETSRVATLLTRELGKIGVIAKGARDPRSPFGSSLELFNLSSYVLYFRPGRDLQFLKSGNLEQEYRALVTDSRRYTWAAALAEFLDRVLLEEAPGDGFFDLVLRGFRVLETEPADSLQELFRGLQLRIATYLGYSPGLTFCGRCRRPAFGSSDRSGSGGHRWWVFIPSEGGIVCPGCSTGEPGGIRLGERELRRLCRMAAGPARPQASVSEVPDRLRGDGALTEHSFGGASQVRDTDSGPDAATDREKPVEPSDGWHRSPAWCRDLDRLVDEFLRFHMDAYRGLRVLDTLPARDARERNGRRSFE